MAIAKYLLPSKSVQLCVSLAAPAKVFAVSFSQPPIFSGSPYLNLTKSPSIHVLCATDSLICLLKPGLNGTLINGIILSILLTVHPSNHTVSLSFIYCFTPVQSPRGKYNYITLFLWWKKLLSTAIN